MRMISIQKIKRLKKIFSEVTDDMPKLEDIYTTYKDQPFDKIALDFRETLELLEEVKKIVEA